MGVSEYIEFLADVLIYMRLAFMFDDYEHEKIFFFSKVFGQHHDTSIDKLCGSKADKL